VNPSSPPLLEMRGITKRFGDFVALDSVDFSVRAGEIHALLGENGAGKSTLMQVLSGLYRMQSGEIRLAGEPVRIESPRDAAAAGIQMVYQHFTLVERFTVAENLALAAPPSAGAPPALGALRPDDPRRAAAPALATAVRLGWSLDPDAPVSRLPVGAQQRLEILKALQREARLLLFDEPTAVLAPPEVEELFGVLRRLRDEGRALVFITHKLAEVMALCDRVTVLRRGRRVATVAVSETDPRELAGWMVGGPATGTMQVPGDRVGLRVPDLSPYPPPRNGEGESGACRVVDCSQNSPPRFGEGLGERSVHPGETGRQVDGPPALVIDALVVPGQARPAVNGVSLTVHRGEIFGLAGVDGNGQVELAEAIWGVRPVSGGFIRFDAESRRFRQDRQDLQDDERPGFLRQIQSILLILSKIKARRLAPRLGWIPQDRQRTGLVLRMSVRENLMLIAHAAPEYRRGPFLRWRKLRALADGLVAQYDIRVADPAQPAASLSGGNQQKIVIARAMFGEPEALVAVNPTRGLDIGATAYVHEQLRRARERGAAILLLSTELDEVTALSDRVGVLYEGRLMGVVPPDTPREELGLMMGGKARVEASA
jgi:general nucleoside transport system ATP-binding protein